MASSSTVSRFQQRDEAARMVSIGVRADDQVNPVGVVVGADVLGELLTVPPPTAVDHDDRRRLKLLLEPAAGEVAEPDRDRVAAALAIADSQDVDFKRQSGTPLHPRVDRAGAPH